MKSSFQLAYELSLMTIEVVKDQDLKNRILGQIESMFDQSDNYLLEKNFYSLDLAKLGAAYRWSSEGQNIILRNIKEKVKESKELGKTNKEIAEEMGVSANTVHRWSK
jgi:hypothetical protein